MELGGIPINVHVGIVNPSLLVTVVGACARIHVSDTHEHSCRTGGQGGSANPHAYDQMRDC